MSSSVALRSEVNTFSLEEAHRFARRLRGDPRSINPQGWAVDWDDAPWPVKVYDGGVRRPLTGHRPPWWAPKPSNTLNDQPGRGAGDLSQAATDFDQLGVVLFSAVGGVGVRWDPSGGPLHSPEHPFARRPPPVGFRRAIPSGGGLYPAELYVLALSAPLGPSAYHYDVWRHELVDLARPFEAEHVVGAALGLSDVGPWPSLLFVLTDRFWKNACKYGNFAYRLGAVDVGVALGRLLACLQGRGPVGVQVDFVDSWIHDLLGIDGNEEGAYAVVSLGPWIEGAARKCPVSTAATGSSPIRGASHSSAPMRPVPLSSIERSRNVTIPADMIAMHASSVVRTQSWPGARAVPMGPHRRVPGRETNTSSAWTPDPGTEAFDNANLLRQSVGHRFTGRSCPAEAITAVLRHGWFAVERYRRASVESDPPRIEFFTLAIRVNDILPGGYRYHPAKGLAPLVGGTERLGDALPRLLHAKTVNLELAAFIVLVVGAVDLRVSRRGARQYRVEQMAAGVAVDALTVAATGKGVGSHPFLGYDASLADRLVGLSSGSRGVLAVVCFGHARPGAVLCGSLAPAEAMA